MNFFLGPMIQRGSYSLFGKSVLQTKIKQKRAIDLNHRMDIRQSQFEPTGGFLHSHNGR